jgi:(2R)-3-sulfolactate dehydrogenase (NADP+)
MSETVALSLEEAENLCFRAARSIGASAEAARSIARAAVAAEADGQPTVGISHFMDYLAGFREGRIAVDARPVISRPLPAVIHSDAGGGVAHLGFDLAYEDLTAVATQFGVAIFAQRNAYTCGSLGYFASRLADRGLVALAATNGPALMAGGGSLRPVYCTNPLAFAAPGADGPALLIDQASSASAFVSIREAAKRGEPIPAGWAIDDQGQPTTNPARALTGALLAFGGARGANIALMVEVLAAGLTGANWSLDAPAFTHGSETPGSGLLVLAINPNALQPDFGCRLEGHLRRLSDDYGVHIPGRAKREKRKRASESGLMIPLRLVQQLKAMLPESRYR